MLMTLLVCVKQSESTLAVRKFVYQKDISEHCRRRVVPSVFLGRHVVGAYSQILHFSKLELPYSCSISVRTESGSSIILVIQLLSDDSLTSSCTENSNQLLVYEMGETFGGYWGPLPDTYMSPKPTGIQLYTLKTTQSTVTKTSTQEKTTSEKPCEILTEKLKVKENDEISEYITVEIPLVNVSGELVPGDPPLLKSVDEVENFDLIFDVTPRLTYPYHIRRYATKYKYNANKRLKFNRNKTHFTKARKNLLKKKMSTSIMDITRQLNTYVPIIKYQTNIVTHSTGDLNKNINKGKSRNQSFENDIKLWKNIENQYFRETIRDKLPLYNVKIKNFTSFISSGQYKYSAYRYPKIDHSKKYLLFNKKIGVNTDIDETTSTVFNNESHTTIMNSRTPQAIDLNIISSTGPFSISNIQIINFTMLNSSKTEGLTSSNLLTNSTEFHYTDSSTATGKSRSMQTNLVSRSETILNTTKQTEYVNTVSQRTENSSLLTGSMVDHVSWENVVQAAPVMAVRLNKTVLDKGSKLGINSTEPSVVSTSEVKVRNIRHIQAIDIEQARPHNRSTRTHTISTPSTQYEFSDVQKFAQLVELQDDHIQDRVALRYMRHYVGRSLFNICDYHEPKARHVYLFNSSRIVIAIRNFTMQRMTVVITPARIMLNGDIRCTEDHLECQVSGTRVCIDSMTACDGVPNCGAYDIYDEDRLMCGAAVGLQHNVCLAAVTFLAVLITMLYVVHYWLKRCVPKVSDAFFIYTDGDDNELYLKSIMRSPNDTDDITKMVYEHVFQDGVIYKDNINKWRQLFSCRWLQKCLISDCIRKKNLKVYDDLTSDQNVHSESKANSFTELELFKMTHGQTVNVSVQTGDSLEIGHVKISKMKEERAINRDMKLILESNKNKYPTTKSKTKAATIGHNRNDSDELYMLKLFKEVRSDSAPSNSSHMETSLEPEDRRKIAVTEEHEIISHLYDTHKDKIRSRGLIHENVSSEVDIDTIEFGKQAMKRLRFDEETITIPSVDYEQETNENLSGQYSTVDNSRKLGQGMDIMASEQPSTSRDFRHFWSNKGKKSKRKSHMSLR
ncbi:uncharacterized protein LOC131844440 isoform X2 [Achroia grisella]|uniref:uncharacterized protein LOC131844440 isoform X2 n=1 Tax=Achroia grisella TaxID=688607 RepID=UPI0027D28AFA|nr:uncharacterized protein LOC131844440 isoform X2 [Achroia grisella]